MVQLGSDSFKQSMPLVNDLLGKLIVLNTALLGLFTGLKELPVPIWFRVLAICCFVLSLLVSFWGIYPRDWTVDPTVPTQIQEAYSAGVKRKAFWLTVAAICLLLGFVLALTGIVYGAAYPPLPPPIPGPIPQAT